MKSILMIILGLLLTTGVGFSLTITSATSVSRGPSVPAHINVTQARSSAPGMVSGKSSNGVSVHSHSRVSRAFRALNLNGIGTVDSSLPSPEPTEVERWHAEYSSIPSRP